MRGMMIAILALTASCAPVQAVPESSLAPSQDAIDWNDLPDWDLRERLYSIPLMGPLTNLAIANPNSAITQRRLLVLAMQKQVPPMVEHSLSRMTDMGLVMPAGAYDQIGTVIDESVAASAAEKADIARTRVGESVVIGNVPTEIRLGEGVVYDEVRGRYFLSSVVERAIYVSEDASQWRKLPVDELGSVTGLVIDKARRALWFATGKLHQTPDPETAFTGLVSLDLDTLEETRRVAALDHVEVLNDVAVATDGTVMVGDSIGGGLYRLTPGSDVMEEIAPVPLFSSPQGIVVHPSQRFAYVADWAYGIAMIDLETLSLKRLQAPADIALDGTDGLYWHEGDLIAIQNGFNPQRIIRYHLDSSGTIVTGATILERANPDWGEPTIGQIVDGNLIYVSNPQWGSYEKGGVIKEGETLQPNPIRSLALNVAMKSE